MGALVALAGWPEIEPPPAAWTGVMPGGAPVVLGGVHGVGPAVVRATSNDGALATVVAGALSNRRELEDALGIAAATVPRDDAAVVLRLYEGRGDNAITALRGAFALALWDGRRQRLLAARDQLGLRPLYYVAERARCAIASALGPLVALPGAAGSPDLALVDLLLAFGTVPAPATIYPGIRQLRPGESMVWEGDRHRTQRYWQLRFPEARSARRVTSGAARRTREQLDDVVRQRTAGVVTGLLLSGGLGAGALLALATGLGRPPACAITVASGDEEDTRRAAALAHRAGLEHEVLRPDIEWARALDDALAARGGPEGAVESVLLAPAVAALATRVRVVIAGAGAEDVLGGGPAERGWAACERYRALPGLVREALDIIGASGRPRGLAWTSQAVRSAPIDVFADLESSARPERRQALYGPELRAATGRMAVPRALVGLVSEAVTAGATHAGDTLHFVRLTLGAPRIGAAFDAAALAGV
ncbi:MAG: asparagine synthase-related protein, partial [Gemmatimonadales bacterium]